LGRGENFIMVAALHYIKCHFGEGTLYWWNKNGMTKKTRKMVVTRIAGRTKMTLTYAHACVRVCVRAWVNQYKWLPEFRLTTNNA
jgi:hypothetical protein